MTGVKPDRLTFIIVNNLTETRKSLWKVRFIFILLFIKNWIFQRLIYHDYVKLVTKCLSY